MHFSERFSWVGKADHVKLQSDTVRVSAGFPLYRTVLWFRATIIVV